MGNLSDNFNLMTLFELEKASAGFAAMAAMELSPERLDELRKRFAGIRFGQDLPDYLKASAELRRDPVRAFPWAKSVIMAALPFNLLPAPRDALPRAKSADTAGMIAGYAARTDYHLHGKILMDNLLQRLEQISGRTFKAEICIDTKPLAERALAQAAGLGIPGRNSCILCPGYGSGCFIVSALLDLELPDVTEKSAATPCPTCGQCTARCPNRVIGAAPADFNAGQCISSLTMEKRGMLTETEMRMMGNHIFGCQICTGACPDSSLPPDFPLDLEWLLSAPSAEVRRAIAGTPMEYAGVTLLRRNALIVLANKDSVKSYNIITTFIRHTRSQLLIDTARSLIKII
ncbi:MAG: epoxyqueuosine reductase [Victivallaceae bacterium]